MDKKEALELVTLKKDPDILKILESSEQLYQIKN